jgi:hypothetical protein
MYALLEITVCVSVLIPLSYINLHSADSLWPASDASEDLEKNGFIHNGHDGALHAFQ